MSFQRVDDVTGQLDSVMTVDDAENLSEQTAKFFKYSEDQPRDDHGRWTDGGGGPLDDKLKRVDKDATYGDGERSKGDAKVRQLLKTSGRSFPVKGRQYSFMSAGRCHQNVAFAYAEGEYSGAKDAGVGSKFSEAKFGIATGYASNGENWYAHSWLYNRNTGTIVETAVGSKSDEQFTHYFGVPLTNKEARKFSRSGGRL